MQFLLACLGFVWIQALNLVEAGRQRYAVLHAGDETTLQGTWSSGSGKVVTGQVSRAFDLAEGIKVCVY